MSVAKSDFSIFLKTLVWLLATLAFYFFLRIEFLTWNWKVWFEHASLSSLIKAFLQGARFDLSILAWLSFIPLIGAIVPWPSKIKKYKELVLRMTFLFIHIPFLVLNIIDLEFIHFSGRRMTTDSLYLIGETKGKIGALWTTYWLLIIINVSLLWLYVRSIHSWNPRFNEQSPLLKVYSRPRHRLILTSVLLLGMIVGARGGTQPKPLELAHATAMSSDFRLTHLTLNSSFTTLHSLQKKRLKRIDYFNNQEQFNGLLNSNGEGQILFPWSKKPKNVVLFVLESFGLEYTGLDHKNLKFEKKSFTPFLDSLQPSSIYFENSFANGRRSIEALPSLLAGIPSLTDEPFLTSSFQTNNLPSLGFELAKKGVWTGFFHGGANGTMFFEEFTQRLGFQKYFGKNEYSAEGDDDGTWGIWDGPFLNFFRETLDKEPSPFFAVFFSLSSHHPFKVPEVYRDQLPTGPIPILQSIAYTDAMLRDFFKASRRSKWFEDTLFIFTADHTSKSYLSVYQTSIGSFRVPMLMYFPGAQLTEERHLMDLEEPVQHIDLLPTLEDLFALPKTSSLIGRSLLKTGRRNVNLYLDGQEIYIEKGRSLTLPTDEEPPTSPHPLLPAWKAHRQYFINGMIDNSL